MKKTGILIIAVLATVFCAQAQTKTTQTVKVTKNIESIKVHDATITFQKCGPQSNLPPKKKQTTGSSTWKQSYNNLSGRVGRVERKQDVMQMSIDSLKQVVVGIDERLTYNGIPQVPQVDEKASIDQGMRYGVGNTSNTVMSKNKLRWNGPPKRFRQTFGGKLLIGTGIAVGAGLLGWGIHAIGKNNGWWDHQSAAGNNSGNNPGNNPTNPPNPPVKEPQHNSPPGNPSNVPTGQKPGL